MATDLAKASSSSASPAPSVHRFTVDEYHQMIDAGILTENDRVQLLQGVIVQMTPIGSRHRVTVTLLHELLSRIVPTGWHTACQQPVRLGESEPEPDISVVRGAILDYVDHIPAGADVGLVIEVADTSLDLDKTDKVQIYAEAGIPEYWIVDLDCRTVTVLQDPKPGETAQQAGYQRSPVLNRDETIAVVLDGNTIGELPVSDLLH